METKENIPPKNELETLRKRVTTLEKLFAELKEIKLKYECLFDKSFESIYIHDLEGRMLELNRAGQILTGYSKEDLPGMRISDILNENQVQQAFGLIDEVINESGPGYPVEFKIRKKDGTWIDVEVFPSSICRDGKPIAIMGVCRDVTDRINYEEAIQESEKNFRAIAENAGDGILVMTGIEGRLSYINRMFSTLSGYNLQELRYKTIKDLLPADCCDTILNRHKAILKGGVFKKTVEAGILKKDGSAVPVEMISARTYWKGEHAELVLIHDIPAQKDTAEHKGFGDNEDLYKLAIEAGGLRFWKWDSETEEIITPRGTTEWKFKGLLDSFLSIIHPDDRGILEQVEKEARAGNNHFTFKARIFKDPTSYNWVQIDGRVYRDDSGNPKRVIGIAKNITDQVNAEKEKVELLREKTDILDAMGDGLIACDMNGKIIEANPAYLNMTGMKRDDLIGNYIQDILSKTLNPEDSGKLMGLYPDILSKNRQQSHEITLISKDGIKTPVQSMISLLKDNEGNPRGMVCVVKDITYQKKAWEFLKFSCDELEFKLSDANNELKYRIEMLDEQIKRKINLEELIKQQRDLAIRLSASIDYNNLITQTMSMITGIPGIDTAGMYIINRETGHLELKAQKGCSDEFVRKVSSFKPGSRQIKMIENGEPMYGLYADLFPSVDESRIKEGLKGFAFIPAFYEEKLIAALSIASHTLDEIPVYAREFFETIAAQIGAALFRMRTEDDLKKNQDELIESKNMYKSLVENINEVFFIVDTKGYFTYLSPSAEKVFGYSSEDMVGRRFIDLLPPEERDKTDDFYINKLLSDFDKGEYRILDKWGDIRWVHFSVENIFINNEWAGLQGIVADITHRKVLQQRLVVSERMAATGQLAASIAHEINSPLQAITITLSSMKKMANGNPDLTDGIDLLKSAFASISNTVRNLLDLNRPGMIEKRQADINDILTKTASLVKSQLRQNRIKITMDLKEDLPPINVSTQHVGQVFLNIINNAIDAMAGEARSNTDYNQDIEGGVIKISSFAEDDMVVVKIEDTGPGIKETDFERVFKPFFSTKKGSGMGIGLAICRTIIGENGGMMTASNSTETKGALFTVKLPSTRTEQ